MALKVSIKEASGVTGSTISSNLKIISSPQRSSLRKAALLLIGFGILIFAYLGLVYVSGLRIKGETKGAQVTSITNPPMADLQTSFKQRTSFGDLLKTEDKPQTTNHKLESFGSILGTQTQTTIASPEQSPLRYFSISVPALQINQAKVTVGVDGNSEQEYGEVLKDSLAHLKGSALPGQKGTVFIFGHSTLPIFAKNNYESIFTNLPKLKTGDMIGVNYGDYFYRYVIYKTAVVDPDDLETLSNTFYPRLVLMTCIPPGFGNRRFIAVAELE